DWCAEIKRALDFFYSTYPDDSITKIMLSGGGANIKDFRQLLSMETSAEVELIDPFSQLELADSLDSLYLKKIAPQAAISVGLALRRIDDK
ncbi:MAG: pilus assembly protein PilM, partial [Proteobacteria bacterium]|nr:pilus assembly protein PilM [Pseudomonadota bacterium]